MPASNIWALIVGGVVAGGAVAGAVVWQQTHPDQTPAKAIAKLTEPPSLNPPKAASSPGGTDGAALTKGPPAKPEPDSGHGEPPHFDVVRVEPSGDAVVAGKGDPNAQVALMSKGKVIAETKSDANGQFVLMPPALSPGDHDLSLRQSADGKPPSDSTQNVAVSVPAHSKGDVMVALAEPGKPTKVLSGPPDQQGKAKPAPAVANAPPTPKAPETGAAPPDAPRVAMAKPDTAVAPPAPLKAAGPDLAIRSVETENGNGFYASGVAAAGSRLQIYLNGAHLAEVVAGPDNRWSLTVKRGLSAGHYVVRADAGGDGRKVTARVEVPFDVPVAMAAAAPAKPAPAAEAPAEMPADLGKPNTAPDALAARMPHEAPPSKATAKADSPPTDGKPAAQPSPGSTASGDVAVAAKETGDAASPGVPPSAANAVIEQVETATVVQGDNLWNISRDRLGQGYRYTRIYAANNGQIRDPKLIYPGQVFVMPAKAAER